MYTHIFKHIYVYVYICENEKTTREIKKTGKSLINVLPRHIGNVGEFGGIFNHYVNPGFVLVLIK